MKKAEAPECCCDPRIDELSEALKVLSDPNRLKIICYLLKGERCVCHVESDLAMSQQLTSHHLNVLKDAGFLKARKEGTWSHYSVNPGYLKKICGMFNKYLDYRKCCSRKDAACRK